MSATGKRNGWIKARFLPIEFHIIEVTKLPEYQNTISVDIAVKDIDGNPITSEVGLFCELLQADCTFPATSAFYIAEVGDGTEISTTNKARLFISTSATGTATVKITDVSGTHDGSIYLRISCVEIPANIIMTRIRFE